MQITLGDFIFVYLQFNTIFSQKHDTNIIFVSRLVKKCAFLKNL